MGYHAQADATEALISYVTHVNAPLTPEGRLKLVQLVTRDGWAQARAAERFLALPPLAGHLTRENVHMGNTRREFTPEYKDEAVKLVINTGRAVATVARELGINEASLGRWVSAFKARNDTGETAVTESERAELLRLRKENADLKLDRAFLKKASIFFAQEASDTNAKRSN